MNINFQENFTPATARVLALGLFGPSLCESVSAVDERAGQLALALGQGAGTIADVGVQLDRDLSTRLMVALGIIADVFEEYAKGVIEGASQADEPIEDDGEALLRSLLAGSVTNL